MNIITCGLCNNNINNNDEDDDDGGNIHILIKLLFLLGLPG